MEELIAVLEKEETEYSKLLKFSEEKTPVIVEGDIEKLQKITDEEQIIVDNVAALDIKRAEIMTDIANVINKDVNTLKLSFLIDMLKGRPKEQQALTKVYDALKRTVGNLRNVNTQNQVLIKQQLDMIDFNISLNKAMREAPETGNYTKNAGIAGNVIGSTRGGFDAKQ
ncbi:MAG: flagellar protein FlgN [Lachnospiraceae bacterium]|nr:flagellar protein FlgN [Lachnospiraceae bacterium]